MIVKQSLNQNALLLIDEKGSEVIGLGKGIGFGKKKGDKVDRETISRFFVVADNISANRLVDIIGDINEKVIEIAEDVVNIAEKRFNRKLSNTFIITISQHIQFAIERSFEDDVEYDVFEHQLRYLYPDEYRVATTVIQSINQKYNLSFKGQEVSFFTLHFVNGLIDSEQFNDLILLSSMLNSVITLMSEHQVVFDTETVEYSRFVVHLRYLLIRLMTVEDVNTEEKFLDLFKMTSEMYPKETTLVHLIRTMLYEEYSLHFGNDEQLFLLLHLIRVLKKG